MYCKHVRYLDHKQFSYMMLLFFGSMMILQTAAVLLLNKCVNISVNSTSSDDEEITRYWNWIIVCFAVWAGLTFICHTSFTLNYWTISRKVQAAIDFMPDENIQTQ